MKCERCDRPISRAATVCRPCHADREQARAALDHEDADRELMALIEQHSYSELARRDGVSKQAIASRVNGAVKRLTYLGRVRKEAHE